MWITVIEQTPWKRKYADRERTDHITNIIEVAKESSSGSSFSADATSFFFFFFHLGFTCLDLGLCLDLGFLGFLKMDCRFSEDGLLGCVCILTDVWVCVCCFCVWLTRKISWWLCVCCFYVWLTRKICCWVCVCIFVLAGNQFVFVFLCLVDKKGLENVRKFGHVFLCGSIV